jgi:hypothetical protein
MNVDSSMCASSGRAAHWEQIDWAKCERQVGRLQARIVKATREGRWTHDIWRALWRWAKRRRPKKSRDWVKKHCFPALSNRAWTFAAKDGQASPGRQTDLVAPRVCGRNQNPVPCQSSAERQSVRPTVAGLLRGTCVPEEVWPHLQRSRDQIVVKPAPLLRGFVSA